MKQAPLISKLFSNTSIHGIPKLIRAQSLKRQLYWSTFLFGSIIGSIWYIVINVQSYLDYSFITNVNLVSEISPQFPTISICSFTEYKNVLFVLNCTFDGKDCGQHLVNQSSNCYIFNSGRSDKGLSRHNILSATRKTRLKLEVMSSFLDNWYKVSIFNSSYDNSANEYLRVSNGAQTNIAIRLDKKFYFLI